MKVAVYSTQTCPYCVLAKDFLKEKGVVFDDIDVSQDRAAADLIVSKTGQMGVPVIIVTKDDGSEQIIVGFDESELGSAVGVA